MVESVTKYRTTDGKEFDDRELARLHELKQEFKGILQEVSEPVQPTGSAGGLMTQMLENPKPFRDALNKYMARLPKAMRSDVLNND